jgi:hypothetical protein
MLSGALLLWRAEGGSQPVRFANRGHTYAVFAIMSAEVGAGTFITIGSDRDVSELLCLFRLSIILFFCCVSSLSTHHRYFFDVP